MRKFILISILFVIHFNSVSQNKFNVVCRDFTFQQEVSTTGKSLRNLFEVAISKSVYPFKVLERDKMDKFFETLQKEKNLMKDLSSEWKEKLQAAHIDYLVVGDLTEHIAADNFDLLINFIKITGNNITEKLPLVITISRKQLANNEELKFLFDKEIQAFVKNYFILGQSDNNVLTIPKFYEELKRRDSIIGFLEVQEFNRLKKEREDEVLKTTPPLIDAGLFIQDSGIVLGILFQNNVPIRYRYFLYGLKKENIEIRLDYSFTELYPSKENPKFFWLDFLKKYVRPSTGRDTITFKFELESLYYPVTRNPKLSGVITKKYILDWDKQFLTEMK